MNERPPKLLLGSGFVNNDTIEQIRSSIQDMKTLYKKRRDPERYSHKAVRKLINHNGSNNTSKSLIS